MTGEVRIQPESMNELVDHVLLHAPVDSDKCVVLFDVDTSILGSEVKIEYDQFAGEERYMALVGELGGDGDAQFFLDRVHGSEEVAPDG